MQAVLKKESFLFMDAGILIDMPDRILGPQLNLNFR